jgi:hypothetical protein
MAKVILLATSRDAAGNLRESRLMLNLGSRS